MSKTPIKTYNRQKYMSNPIHHPFLLKRIKMKLDHGRYVSLNSFENINLNNSQLNIFLVNLKEITFIYLLQEHTCYTID